MDALKEANQDEAEGVMSKLQILRAAGCPADKTRGNPEIEHVGKCVVLARKKPVSVYVLKPKPGHWRLYFHIANREARVIEFLYSVKKKTNKRDPKDLDRCCTVLGDIFAGRTTRAPV